MLEGAKTRESLIAALLCWNCPQSTPKQSTIQRSGGKPTSQLKLLLILIGRLSVEAMQEFENLSGWEGGVAPAPLYHSRCGIWFHRHRRHILIAHQLIKCRHISLHNLRQLRQLRIDLHDQFIINGI